MKFNKKRNEKKKEDRKKEVAESEGNDKWRIIDEKATASLPNLLEREDSALFFASKGSPRIHTLVEKGLSVWRKIKEEA